MGRNRTQLHLSSSQQTEVDALLKRSRDQRTKERLLFLKLASIGEHTLDELAGLVGRSRSTLQNWVEKFMAGGIAGLIERGTPPGRKSPLADAKIQKQLRAGLRSGRLKTAAEVAAWLLERHGFKRARKSIYYWLQSAADDF